VRGSSLTARRQAPSRRPVRTRHRRRGRRTRFPGSIAPKGPAFPRRPLPLTWNSAAGERRARPRGSRPMKPIPGRIRRWAAAAVTVLVAGAVRTAPATRTVTAAAAQRRMRPGMGFMGLLPRGRALRSPAALFHVSGSGRRGKAGPFGAIEPGNRVRRPLRRWRVRTGRRDGAWRRAVRLLPRTSPEPGCLWREVGLQTGRAASPDGCRNLLAWWTWRRSRSGGRRHVWRLAC
jgi:hypothetical protein